MYVFPSIGLGAALCKPSRITDTMIYAVSKALANSLDNKERARGELYPRIERIRDVSARLTAAFITQAVHEGNVRDQHWVHIVEANMPEGVDTKTVSGLFTKRVLGEVKALMWEPASSVEQYMFEAITFENPDEI
ncbi:hypothetical protein GGH20_002629 [Coemansia sp. RSA 1937]|nr:hypothetical protein GGH20_002629 [Coemansia sp. RSA 1937]